ncbi:nucleotidyltransferase domain-containing protein [Paenibacillus marinisediminis]
MHHIISQARAFLEHASFDWAICGGGAIDLYIGQDTRSHKDIDIAVYWEDRGTIITYMLSAGWRVFEACGGGIIQELFTNDSRENRNLFCFTISETRCHLEPIGGHNYRFTFANEEQHDFNYVEFLFNRRDHDDFYYSRNENVKRSLEKATVVRHGHRLLSPEMVLLNKSTYLDGPDSEDHHHDFNMVLSYLNDEQKLWFKQALEVVHTGDHPWLQKL